MVKAGGDSWFFLTADYAFGHALERDTSAVVKAAAARCWARCATRSTATDFSSFLLQAQASRRQGDRPGQRRRRHHQLRSRRRPSSASPRAAMKLAGLLMFINDVHALGLETAQGLVLTESFYWDLNDEHPRLVASASREEHRAACRPWCRPAATARRAALPEGGRGADGSERRRRGGRAR